MLCPELDKLLETYSAAAKAYHELLARMLNLHDAELDEARKRAAELRAACDRAGQAIEDHRREHGC